jgi:hypothetical protein
MISLITRSPGQFDILRHHIRGTLIRSSPRQTRKIKNQKAKGNSEKLVFSIELKSEIHLPGSFALNSQKADPFLPLIYRKSLPFDFSELFESCMNGN